VLNFEPHLALFVPDNDPLLFYRKIIEFAAMHLKAGGQLFFEIHRDRGQEVMQLLSEAGFAEIELRKDLSGNDRMLKAGKKEN
jgi:release factor glutamine methyltransferase